MAGGLHYPGGLREQCHGHERQRQPLLPDCLAGLRPGRPGGLSLYPGTAHQHVEALFTLTYNVFTPQVKVKTLLSLGRNCACN